MSNEITLTLHVILITSLLLSGIFIMTVRGVKRPVIYMSIPQFITVLLLSISIYQTYNTSFYGQSLWNPLHLLSLLIAYPLSYAYIFGLMRPGSIRTRYWLLSIFPILGLVLLHTATVAFRGALPLFDQYADMYGYFREPELWIRLIAVLLFVAEIVIFTIHSIHMLREHKQNLQSNFSYTEGNTLGWMWWYIAFIPLKGITVTLLMSIEGRLRK